MSASSTAKLYSREVLGLATELANYPHNPAHSHHAYLRSRTCGSTISISLSCGKASEIDDVGMIVSACAVGQAAAAIFAKQAVSAVPEDVRLALGAIDDWLAERGPCPNWPGIDVLSEAKAFPGRHEAILLPWRAASEALFNAGSPS